MKFYYLYAFLLICGCAGNDMKDEKHENAVESRQDPVDKTIIDEIFVDSLNIGLKGENKIHLTQYRTDSGSVVIKFSFFSRQGKEWILKQYEEFEKDEITGPQVEISDFNKDGLNDITMRSAIAARGINEVRRLYVFDREKGELLFMKNSESYPNLKYNKELDCLYAWLVYGGSSSVFLNIDADSLREFARVDAYDNIREVSLISGNGKERIIRKDKAVDGVHVRYSNYKTMEVEEAF
jgi:hypothetical protein